MDLRHPSWKPQWGYSLEEVERVLVEMAMSWASRDQTCGTTAGHQPRRTAPQAEGVCLIRAEEDE